MDRVADSHFHGGRLIGTSYIRPFPLRLPGAGGIGPDKPFGGSVGGFAAEPPLAHAPSRLIVRRDRPDEDKPGFGRLMRTWLLAHAAMLSFERFGSDQRT